MTTPIPPAPAPDGATRQTADPARGAEVLPGFLQNVVDAYRDSAGESLLSRAAVADRCVEVSDAFVALCRQHGTPARTISGAKFGEYPEFPGVTLMLSAHYANLVPATYREDDVEWTGELVIDWTVHQFTGAPETSAAAHEVPWIGTLEDWRAEWPSFPEGHDLSRAATPTRH